MKTIHKMFFISLIMLTVLVTPLKAAFLRDMPVSVTQPNGDILKCYASGDEFHNWLHDAKGFTIIQSPQTGYYVYAEKQGDELVAGSLIVGLDNPKHRNIVPNLNISQEKYKQLRTRKFNMPETRDAPTSGTINNIVIFIRFSDETEFNQQISTYDGWFNTNTSSQRNYFLEASYNQLTVNTTFYPAASNGYIVSWQDSHPRSYYQPYNATSNPTGYQNDTQSKDREFTLLENAIAGVQLSVPQDLAIDMDNDGRVDNVVFTVKGDSDGWSDLLWPHRWSLYDRYVYLRGKRVYDFNFQLEEFLDYSSVGVICHEFFHTLGAPDLYHYTEDGISPASSWDLMEATSNPPQHMGAYMKYKYGGWIPSITTISADAMYTLNPLTSSTNNCYRINSPNTASEYFVVEYRRKTGNYESSLPGSGLLIYRINPAYEGNADGPPDEVYIYRPNGTTSNNGSPYSAYYNSSVGRTSINASTNPSPFLSNGSAGGLILSSIGEAGESISFVKGDGLANISWSPSEIEVSLAINSSISRNVIIGNTGNVPLNYTLSKPRNSNDALSESFESTTTPSGWTEEHVSGTAGSWTYTSGGYNGNPASAFEGINNARYYHSSSTASVSKLITPALNLEDAESAQLSFHHTQTLWASDQDELRVYYRTSVASAWNLLATYTESITEWTERIINLPNISSTYQIAFEATGQYGYGVCLDAVSVSKEIAADYSWVTINGTNSYTSSIAPNAANHSVSVTFLTTDLPAGDYSMDLSLTSNSAQNSDITIPLSLNVTSSVPQTTSYTSPLNGVSSQNLSGELVWQSASGASGYRVYLCDDNTFFECSFVEVNTNSYSYSNLSYDKTYYWKVIPFNSIGEAGGNIEVWSFTTLADPSLDLPVSIDFEDSTNSPTEIVSHNFLIQTNHHNTLGNVMFKNIYSTQTSGYIQFQSVRNIISSSAISFDYRLTDWPDGLEAISLEDNHNYLVVKASLDGGLSFSQIDQINSTNHINSANFATHTTEIGDFAGQSVIFRLEMEDDTVHDYWFDIDNIYFGNTSQVTIAENDGNQQAPIVLNDKNLELEFIQPNTQGFTLQIIMEDSVPANSIGMPATMESFLPRHWRVISSVPNPGSYNITFELAGLGLSNYTSVRCFKRANSSEEWVDVVNLGASMSWNGSRVSLSGLETFSEFAVGLDETLPVTLASFNVAQTSDNFARLNWITASETNLLGYNIYRAETDNHTQALRVTSSIIEAYNSTTGGKYSYQDDEVEMNVTYYYWLETNDLAGISEIFGPVSLKLSSHEDNEIDEILLGTQLLGNYPNPFNPRTVISFSVAEAQLVTIDIYNIKGQLVKRLLDARVELPNKKHSVVWNGDDHSGRKVSSGIYFTLMKAGKKSFSKKIILIK